MRWKCILLVGAFNAGVLLSCPERSVVAVTVIFDRVLSGHGSLQSVLPVQYNLRSELSIQDCPMSVLSVQGVLGEGMPVKNR